MPATSRLKKRGQRGPATVILAGFCLIASLALAATTQPVYATTSVVVSQQCALSSSAVSAGTTLTATGTLQNLGTSSVKLRDVVLARRPPLGTHEGGPYEDFAPDTSGKLVPGQCLTLISILRFTAAEQVCACICYL